MNDHRMIDEVCPKCREVFRAGRFILDGSKVKRCPNGHVTTAHELSVFRRKTKEGTSFEDKPPKSEREAHLESALSAVLDSYGRALVTIPKTSLYYAIVEGAMEKQMAMAARVLAA